MALRSDTRFTQMSGALKALADPTRLRILGLVAGGEVCVCHLHEALGIPQPTASRHLAYLRRAGLVRGRREGLWVYYSLAKLPDDTVQALVGAVTHCAGHADTVAQDRTRLERATGCRCVIEPCRAELACCAPAAGSKASA
jgi:ArsR family transcriptional regulator